MPSPRTCTTWQHREEVRPRATPIYIQRLRHKPSCESVTYGTQWGAPPHIPPRFSLLLCFVLRLVEFSCYFLPLFRCFRIPNRIIIQASMHFKSILKAAKYFERFCTLCHILCMCKPSVYCLQKKKNSVATGLKADAICSNVTPLFVNQTAVKCQIWEFFPSHSDIKDEIEINLKCKYFVWMSRCTKCFAVRKLFVKVMCAVTVTTNSTYVQLSLHNEVLCVKFKCWPHWSLFIFKIQISKY